MITEIIRYRLDPSQIDAFVAAYRVAQARLRMAPTCLGWDLHQCDEAPECFVLQIRWTSSTGHLEDFRKGPHFPPFLASIRPYVDAIEEMRHYHATPVSSTETISDAAGGLAAFRSLAEGMHTAMAEDDLLGSWFRAAAPEHVAHLAAWLTQVFGGPPLYTDALTDLSLMLRKHGGLDIPEDKRARFAEIAAARAAAQWPERPDVVRAVTRYVEWGTHVAVENSRPGHIPDPTAGVPTWGWDD